MKALIVTALENELDIRRGTTQARPIGLPLISGKTPGCHDLKPDEINDILTREEAAAYDRTTGGYFTGSCAFSVSVTA